MIYLKDIFTKTSKYLNYLLVFLLFFVCFAYFVHVKTLKNSYQSLLSEHGKVLQVIDEKNGIYSVQNKKIKDLTNALDELIEDGRLLKDEIEKRSEQILALNSVSLKWKDKYLKLQANQSVVDDNNNPIEVSRSCQECLSSIRLKVDFEHKDSYLRVYGHTLTNPPEAEVNIQWLRELKLNFVITRTKDKEFKLYLDTDNSDIIPNQLSFIVDKKAFEPSFFERFSINSNILVGNGLFFSSGLMYDFNKFSIGPSAGAYFNGNKLHPLYGVSASFYPFK